MDAVMAVEHVQVVQVDAKARVIMAATLVVNMDALVLVVICVLQNNTVVNLMRAIGIYQSPTKKRKIWKM